MSFGRALVGKRVIFYLMFFAIVLSTLIAFGDSAFASTIPKIGGATGSAEDIEKTIESLIFKIRIIGVLIIIACLVIGFIIVGLSLGNAQKRAIGISAVVCAAIAIYGVAKAPALANWMIDDAQKKTTYIEEIQPTIQTANITYTL
ncbi:hypothetical protein [Paenibacillus sp. IITD108]|uniref:hypothetical protein n=1 Tax=Paenibacillus sp. IITD108 TaxID=3116649 RepID=UPI002F42ED57